MVPRPLGNSSTVRSCPWDPWCASHSRCICSLPASFFALFSLQDADKRAYINIIPKAPPVAATGSSGAAHLGNLGMPPCPPSRPLASALYGIGLAGRRTGRHRPTVRSFARSWASGCSAAWLRLRQHYVAIGVPVKVEVLDDHLVQVLDVERRGAHGQRQAPIAVHCRCCRRGFPSPTVLLLPASPLVLELVRLARLVFGMVRFSPNPPMGGVKAGKLG